MQQFPVHFVCLYNPSVLLDRQLLVGLHTHSWVITRAGVCRNPFFVEPGIFARSDERAQFRYWLKTISPTEDIDASLPELPAADFPASDEDGAKYHLETLDPLVSAHSSEGRWKIAVLGTCASIAPMARWWNGAWKRVPHVKRKRCLLTCCIVALLVPLPRNWRICSGPMPAMFSRA
jgi:hypothetical protein